MKKFLLIIMASLMTVSMMAIGRNDGKTKANAIEFDWDKGVTHLDKDTLWYRVDLKPLYDEENPSLTLYLTNPSNDPFSSVKVSMKATVAGQQESKTYTIAARQYKTYTANAKALVTLKQEEIYLQLYSEGSTPETPGTIKLSAKVFETADLDEDCKDARTLKWNTPTVQKPTYSAWWRVDLTPVKEAYKKDAKITLTNTGSKTVTLKVGQSLDCPSSGTTKRTYVLEPGDYTIDTVPQSMIQSVQPNEVYFGVENVESEVTMLVELVNQPAQPIIPENPVGGFETLQVKDTMVITAGKHYYRISVAEMRDTAKYEPEFTYRNEGTNIANLTVKMAFEVPAYGTSNTAYTLAEGEEEIVVYKKNMLEGLSEDIEYIYLLTETDQDIHFYGRFKHVREGKACKTNIDFNWETGHTQEARITQWYAIDVADAKLDKKDIMVYLLNLGDGSAKVDASMAFSCPYIDLTEMSRTISAKGDTVKRRLGYSSYAMMNDTIWIGLYSTQDIRFWADTVSAVAKPVPDPICLQADTFNWDEGVVQNALDTVWYVINMVEVREKAAKFPTVFVQNMSGDAAAKITAELSLECPDSLENQKQSITIAANDSYSRKIARNMFENIVQDEIYLRVVSTQKISIQIRLNEEAEGTSCASAIPFNWTSGHAQAANNGLWYKLDLRDAIKGNYDMKLSVENKDNTPVDSVCGQLTFGCPDNEAPSVQYIFFDKKEKKTVYYPHSVFQLLPDSTIYVNLFSKTAMHISAELVTPEPITPITGEGLDIDTLLLDSKESILQNAATQWYLIPMEEIQHMRDTNKVSALTPNIQIENISASDCEITIEAAFAFPVTETMINQKFTVGANQSFVHALDYKLFMSAINKFDSVLVRISVPAGAAGNIRIRSSVEKAFNGNTREAAIPILIGELYEQEAGTRMWYKLNTADLKKDKNMYNKRLWVSSANKGTGDAKISLKIYEGLHSNVDMLEQYGLDNYRERTIQKGKTSKEFPAQALYAIGDVELYLEVTTNQPLSFNSKFNGEYAPIAEDPKQKEAQLLVPNVDYVVPADGDTHWYQICNPYIRNNYMYTHASTLSYEVNQKATIEATTTFQDVMDCKMPVRSRTIDPHKGKKPLSELVNKGLKKVLNQNFDVSTFKEDFIDSMLHRYLTSDTTLTLYIRLKTTADLKVRLNMPQITGDSCLNPMIFDWEHGNFNEAKTTHWIQVNLDETRVPEGKDLKLHMDNWSSGPTNVEAKLYVANCKKEDELGKVKKLIVSDTTKVLERQFLEQELGWSDFMIEYYSDSTTYIWAELVDPTPREKKDSTLNTVYVCPYTNYRVPHDDEDHIIDPDSVESWTWEVKFDSIFKSEGKIVTYKFIYDVRPLNVPELLSVDSLKSQPVIAIGDTVDVAASITEILNDLNKQVKEDKSIMKVGAKDSIVWEYSMDGGKTFTECPTPVLTSASIALRYKVILPCDTFAYSDTLYNTIHNVLLPIDTCGPYTWVRGPKDSTVYTKIGNTKDTIKFIVPATGLDSIVYFDLTITPNVMPAENDSACKKYEWNINDTTYIFDADSSYVDTVLVGNCYNIYTHNMKILPPVKDSLGLAICFSYDWKLSDGFDTTIYDNGLYYHTVKGGDECDTVFVRNVTIRGEFVQTLNIVPKYGDRLLMINRKEINDMDGWYLDSLADQSRVKWYKDAGVEGDESDDIFLTTGFYLTNSDGSQDGEYIQPKQIYYAKIGPILGDGTPDNCGYRAKTKPYTTGKASAAPALRPSLARPGEDIEVVNLDPEQTTTIRIYTFDGSVRDSYTVSGKESFTIKAATENGFYLVELYSDSYKSTLRYIVK